MSKVRETIAWEEIDATDMVHLRQLIPTGKLDALMPGACGFTPRLMTSPVFRFWLQESHYVKLGFQRRHF